MMIPCKTCGQLTETKNKNYVLCEPCMKKYLYDLEELAKENEKKSKHDQLKQKQYNSLYKKIERAKNRLIDIPREVAAEKAYDRDCLRCNKGFVAYGRFNRICTRCKDIISTYEDTYL